MPIHLHNANFEKIPLSIQRKDVNIYLSELWDDFNETIGLVSCQHSYLNTEDSEVYEYNVCWASNGLPFIAELSFFNHTAKGLIYVLLETLDFETRAHDSEYHKKIKDSLLRCSKKLLGLLKLEPAGYLAVPVKSANILSGNYIFELSNILLLTNGNNNFDMVFPVYNQEPYEQRYEGQSTSVNLVSILSLLTQNVFFIDESLEWKFINKSAHKTYVANTEFNGKYFPDDGLIFSIELLSNDGAKYIVDDPQQTKEIIEKRDCIVNDRLKIPERTDVLIDIINNNYRLQQSCRRFHEGLMFRSQIKRAPSSIYYAAYELISYVAAIEACLNTEAQQTEVACPACGGIVYKEEWKISEKFRKFVADNSESNPILIRAFKELYNDRSMFVHTGINLHTLNSARANRPLILRGKRCQSELPDYYFNIHDYTGFLLRKHFYQQLVCLFEETS